MKIALTKKELADLAGYSYRRLHTIDTALPNSKKLFVTSEENEKKFDLALFIQRWVAYNKEVSEEESDELSVVKAQHERIKKEKTQIEVNRMKGELVEIEEVDRLWSNVAGLVRRRFVNLAKKVAPALVMMDDVDRIEEIIDRDVRDALSMIAKTPLPDDHISLSENEEWLPGDDGGEEDDAE